MLLAAEEFSGMIAFEVEIDVDSNKEYNYSLAGI
jgi:hypothetical protein